MSRMHSSAARGWMFLPAVLFSLLCGAERAAAQSGARAEKITIGYPSRGITVLPLRIAQVKGFFKAEGIEPEIIQMRAAVTVTALTTGDIDYGAPLDSIIRASARGLPLKGLMSFVNKPMHYLIARPEFNSVRDLRGKTLAISAFGSTEQLTTFATLKANGLDPDRKDVKVVALGDSPVRLEALKQGIVDATVILIPFVIVAENLGFRILANAGDYLELSTPGLGTSDRLLREKPDQVRKTVRAAAKGLAFIRQNREETVRIIMDWLTLDKDTAGKAYQMGLKAYSEDGTPSEKGVMTSVRLETEKAGVKKDIPMAKVFELSMIQEARKEIK
ncbi:MAG TPA: ABC transporter substrate-binding protein [Candidatus Binatia bacterium]|nr:ABC transporter substrate-binding protein [Candidatus Binatia bacterium]